MIWNFRRAGFVLVFPALMAVGSVALTIACVVAPVPLSCAILTLGLGVLAVREFRFLRVSDERLLVRSPFRIMDLDARSCAFGIELQKSASRHSRFRVFVSDGSSRRNIADTQTLFGAKRQAERLNSVLLGNLPGAGRTPQQARAAAALAALELELSPSVQAAKVAEFWAVPGRRKKYWVALIVFGLALELFKHFL